MASFRPLTITPPASLTQIGEQLSPSLQEVGSNMASGAQGLGGLGLPSLPPLPPLPGSPPSADELRGGQSAMLTKHAACLMLSPYDYGTGQRRGEEAWLTPVQAIRALGTRLGGLSFDLSGMGTGALVLLLAVSADQAGMAAALKSLNAAFPLPDVQKLERRAEGVARLNRDKFAIPPCPASPAFKSRSPESVPQSREASRIMGAQLAQAEGREAAQKPIGDVLTSFANRRAEALKQSTADMQALTSALASAVQPTGWWGFYLEGMAAEAARMLASITPPVDAAFKCCSVICWYGKKDEVAYYKELFGL